MQNPEVVLITGASAIVRRATTRAFAKRNARIGLIARGETRLAATKAEVEREDGTALVLLLLNFKQNADPYEITEPQIRRYKGLKQLIKGNPIKKKIFTLTRDISISFRRGVRFAVFEVLIHLSYRVRKFYNYSPTMVSFRREGLSQKKYRFSAWNCHSEKPLLSGQRINHESNGC